MCLVVALTLNLFTPLVYADNVTSNSIGSVNREDDGVNVGVDETQSEKTIYNDETDSPINESGEQETLVYVSQASTFFVKIPKTIILGGKLNESGANSGTYEVSVGGNIGGEETIDVVPEKTFFLKQLGKNDIKAYVSQDKESWAFDEVDVIANGLVSTNDMSAGTWNGSFVFNIELLQKTKIGVEAFDSNSENLNATATLISGIKREQLLDALEEQGLATKDEVDELIEVNSNEFDTIATTTFDVSSIAKQGEKVTILHFDEEKGEWEFIATKVVDENGEITADFTSYSPVAFVKVEENGNIHRHEFVDGVCSCGATKTRAGYYENDELVYTWDEFLSYTSMSVSNGTLNKATNTTNLKALTGKLVIDENVTTIGKQAFYGIKNIQEITLPNSVKIIEQSGFNTCSSLTKITLSNELLTIGDSAFAWCDNLTTITIPTTTTTIEENAFTGAGLTSVTFENTNGWYVTTTKNLIEGIDLDVTSIDANAKYLKTTYDTYYWYRHEHMHNFDSGQCECGMVATKAGYYKNNKLYWNWEEFLANTGMSVTNDTLNASGNNANLKSLTGTIVIDDSVTTIGKKAFYGIENTQKISLPNSVTTIEDSAFNGCGLREIDISNELLTIGDSAFAWCDNLTTITIPTTTTTIEENAFTGAGLISVIFENTNGWYVVTIQNLIEGIDLDVTNMDTNAKYLKTTYDTYYWHRYEHIHDFDNGQCECGMIATKAGYYKNDELFYTWEEFLLNTGMSVTSGTLNASGNNANLKSLTGTIVIDDSVTIIGKKAFYSIENTQKISLPNSVTTIENSAFNGCSSLREIELSNQLITIGDSSFAWCDNLKTINIPNTTTTISRNAFYGCTALNDLIIPNDVTTIGSNAFKNVPHITYNGTATGSPWGATSIN